MQSKSHLASPIICPNEQGRLSALPFELLVQIIAHIDTARTLLYLLLTCKRIRSFIEQDGFRVFVQTNFPYVQFPTFHLSKFWRDAAHGLTTLERNWERKAFIAWSIDIPAEERSHRRRRAQSGQTMGFVPAIDSYETWYGGDWSARKEVVAWSTGASLVMRVKFMGDEAKNMWKSGPHKNSWRLNVHKQMIKWAKYKDPAAAEGRDDITSVNTLESQSLSGPEKVVIGRASGALSLIALTPNEWHDVYDQAECLASFETAGRTVRSTCQNASGKHLLAACVSDSSLALYPLDTAHGLVRPIGEVSVLPTGLSGRTWSSCFLNHEHIAVGHGPSQEPIKVYDIGRGQLVDKGVRSLALSNTTADECLDAPSTVHPSNTSVYSLASVDASSLAGGLDGRIFLSGAYDGLAR